MKPNTIIQYNTKFVKRHVAVASEALITVRPIVILNESHATGSLQAVITRSHKVNGKC